MLEGRADLSSGEMMGDHHVMKIQLQQHMYKHNMLRKGLTMSKHKVTTDMGLTKREGVVLVDVAGTERVEDLTTRSFGNGKE